MLTRRGAAPVKSSTGNIFPRKYLRIPRDLLPALGISALQYRTGNFLGSDPYIYIYMFLDAEKRAFRKLWGGEEIGCDQKHLPQNLWENLSTKGRQPTLKKHPPKQKKLHKQFAQTPFPPFLLIFEGKRDCLYKRFRNSLRKLDVYLGGCFLLGSAFWLTAGSFLLTVELFYLQLCLGAFSQTIGARTVWGKPISPSFKVREFSLSTILKKLIAICLNHFVLIEVCSGDILVACCRICTGFKGDSFRETHLWEHFGRTDTIALITCLKKLNVSGTSLTTGCQKIKGSRLLGRLR